MISSLRAVGDNTGAGHIDRARPQRCISCGFVHRYVLGERASGRIRFLARAPGLRLDGPACRRLYRLVLGAFSCSVIFSQPSLRLTPAFAERASARAVRWRDGVAKVKK